MAKKKISEFPEIISEKNETIEGEEVNNSLSEIADELDGLPDNGNVEIETIEGKFFKKSMIKLCRVSVAKILIKKGAARLAKKQ